MSSQSLSANTHTHRHSHHKTLKHNSISTQQDLLVVTTCGEAHDAEDAVQLVVVEGVAGLDVLLAAVEDGLRGQKLGEDAADGPDVWSGPTKHTHPNTERRSTCCTRSQNRPLRATSVLLALTDGFGVVSSPKEQFRGPVPEGHYYRVKVSQRLQW